MDFSADPAVAVWFASQRRADANESANSCATASVYVMDLEAARQHGARIVLPPPFVERLYLQRGLFVERDDAAPLPREQLLEIRFPANRKGNRYRFDVIREGRRVEIFANHSWVRKVVDWAWKMTKDPNLAVPTRIPQPTTAKLAAFLKDNSSHPDVSLDDREIDTLFTEFGLYLNGLKECGLSPEFFYQREIQLQIATWLDSFNDYIYWLAMRFTATHEKYEVEPIVPLVKQNMNLAKEYVRIRMRSIEDDIVQRGLDAEAIMGHLQSVQQAINAAEQPSPDAAKNSEPT